MDQATPLSESQAKPPIGAAQPPEAEHATGALFFFSIPNHLEIPSKTFTEYAKHLDLPEEWLPSPIRLANAFKRAATGLTHRERSEEGGNAVERITRIITVPGLPSRRNIVQETRVGTHPPQQDLLGYASYDNAEGLVLSCHAHHRLGIQAFDTISKRLRDAYDQALENYTHRDLRNLLWRSRRELCSISMRESGAVYYCPPSRIPLLQGLQQLLSWTGCEMWILDARDVEPERIAEKLTKAIEAEARCIHRGCITQNRRPQAASIQDLLTRVQDLHRLLLAYADLPVDFTTASRAVEAASRDVSKLPGWTA